MSKSYTPVNSLLLVFGHSLPKGNVSYIKQQIHGVIHAPKKPIWKIDTECHMETRN